MRNANALRIRRESVQNEESASFSPFATTELESFSSLAHSSLANGYEQHQKWLAFGIHITTHFCNEK